MTGALAPTKPLSVADRCDRCGAQAYVRAVLVGGGDLLFCAHHGRAHQDALRAQDADIQDQSDALASTPGTAPDDEH